MDLKTIQAALDALLAGDNEACAEILKNVIAQAAAGNTGGAAPPAGTTPTTENAEPPPVAPGEDEETKAARALARELMTLSRTDSCGAVEKWVKELAAARVKLDADRDALEASERRSLVTELVTLKAETPGTAWERDAAGNIPTGDARKPVKRLASESLESLRERVAALKPTAPPRRGEIKPPIVKTASDDADEADRVIKTPHGEVTVSAREVKNCAAQKVKIEDYAANKAIREAARRGGK